MKMNNEQPETHSKNMEGINQKRKNSGEEEYDHHQFITSSQQPETQFSGNEEEDNEEDMLELRLNSQRPSRPRPSVPPQSQQPQTQSLPSNLQLSNTHPLYPLQLAPGSFLHHHFNGFYVPNGQSSTAVQAAAASQPQPPLGFHQEMSPTAIQIPPPPPSLDVGPRPAIRPVRSRRNPNQAPGQGKPEMVPAPFPWATTKRATVHSLNYLRAHNILTITGDVQCKRCERQYEIEYNLEDKFTEVGNYIYENRSRMHDRAPDVWKDPVLPNCRYCEQENSVRPVLAEKKKAINWLCLLLGQMLGCCTLEQLKYFCKHTKNHRTGAKDRVLYLTYLCLCKQLDPNGPFDV